MSNESEMRAFAKHMIDCVEKGDFDGLVACYAPDGEVWNNTDQKVISPSDIAGMLQMFDGLVTDKKYDRRELHVFPGGFVQRHMICGTRKSDGVRVEMPACLLVEVEGGKAVRSFDYIDSAKGAEFMV